MDQHELKGIEEIKLERQTYTVGKLIELEAMFDDVFLDYILAETKFQMQVVHRPFAQVLQQEEVIASYPSDNWQWFKSLLGLKYDKRIHLLTEHITFPNHKFPKSLGETKVFIQKEIMLRNSDVCDI